jgi:hypothetical protein
MPIPIRYHFSQPLRVFPQPAFDWCTAFDSADYTLMGKENAQRKVTRLAEGSFILTDTYNTPNGDVETQRLVQIYPEQYTWVSTHLTGPNKHSQFIYQIKPQSKGTCVLNFTALHLEYNEKADAKMLAERLCKEDSDVWKLLATALEKDVWYGS